MGSNNVKVCARLVFEDPAKCSATTILDISSSAPTVFTGQKLRGTLFVSHDQGTIFDTVQLILRGEVRTIIKLEDGTHWKMKKPLVLMSSVKLAEDFQQVPLETFSTLVHQVSFFFDVPESITLPSNEKNMQQRLPPSVLVVNSATNTVRENDSSVAASSCNVSYSIEARILKKGRLACNTIREIIILPATEIPPPLEPKHFREEYQLVGTSLLRPLFEPANSITVVVTSLEPRPLVFPANAGQIGSTEVLLYFKTRVFLNENGEDVFTKTQLADCQLSVALEAITYFSAHEQTSALSVVEAAKSPLVILKKRTCKLEKRKLRLTWRKTREILTGTARHAEIETVASIITLLPENFTRLPSFFSALVTRRYALDLKIIFGLGRNTTSHKPIKLRIPVQIVHRQAKRCPDRPAEEELEDFLEAPAYCI